MHIALCRANRWSVSPSGAGPWTPASPDPGQHIADQQCACGSGEAGVRRPATKGDTVSPSGPRTPDPHAPERDTDQRFAVCVAPFLRLELGCASVCVFVRRCWSPHTRSQGGHGPAVHRAECNVRVGLAGLDQDLTNQSRYLAKQSQDLAKLVFCEFCETNTTTQCL